LKESRNSWTKRVTRVSYQMDNEEIESLINDLGYQAKQRDLYYQVF